MPVQRDDNAIEQWKSTRWPVLKKKPIVKGALSIFAVEFPAGTVYYEGLTAYQWGIYLGGADQIFIHQPWNIPGVGIVGSIPLR